MFSLERKSVSSLSDPSNESSSKHCITSSFFHFESESESDVEYASFPSRIVNHKKNNVISDVPLNVEQMTHTSLFSCATWLGILLCYSRRWLGACASFVRKKFGETGVTRIGGRCWWCGETTGGFCDSGKIEWINLRSYNADESSNSNRSAGFFFHNLE